MKPTNLIILSLLLALLMGCVSADFKVVDALKPGMTGAEAVETIRAYGFDRAEKIARPANGWPNERADFVSTAWRAGRMEEQKKEEISVVEYYPVHHGLLGAGQLFLFYDKQGRLLDFYRYQIN